MREEALPTIKTVIGIIKRNQEFLINERPKTKPYSGYWEFPGGKIEAAETSQEALKRELYEELGIEIISAQFFFHHTHTYPDKIVTLGIWLINEYTGEPRAKENQILQWATLDKISELKLLDGNWEIIKRLQVLSS